MLDDNHPLFDPDRLAALATYEVLDTPLEFEHDALTEIASEICPVRIVSAVIGCHRAFSKKCKYIEFQNRA